MPDFNLSGTLKTLRQVPDPEHKEGVLFSLIFQAQADSHEHADAMLSVGAIALDQDAGWKFEGAGTGFERLVRVGFLQKLAATCGEDAGFKVSFAIQVAADLDEARRLWEDFLPQVGTGIYCEGYVRQAGFEFGDTPKEAA